MPPKLDGVEMSINLSDSYNVTKILTCTIRDSGLHARLAMEMSMCVNLCIIAATSRSSIRDVIAGNTGLMAYNCTASTAISRGVNMDLSSSALSDEREVEGEFVWTPKSGCYKGVVVIDGNSLYGSIITKIGIFINRYTSLSTPSGLA